MTIPSDHMTPIDLLLLKTRLAGLDLSPTALCAQWRELQDPAGWALHQATAIAADHRLASYIELRLSLSD